MSDLLVCLDVDDDLLSLLVGRRPPDLLVVVDLDVDPFEVAVGASSSSPTAGAQTSISS